jgi:UDP-N-acetyl-2-amino-2-deoxyglucuronate dehydrogenase
VRIALVGAGVQGSLHADVLDRTDGLHLVAVVDLDEARAHELAAPRGATAGSDLQTVLERADVDAVSVCVPSGLHAGVGEQVLQAGKHLLMEKPLDVTLAAADRVIAAERASGRTVGVVSQRRFQPAFAFLRGLVDSGRIGLVTSCLSESPFWRTQDYYDGGDWRGTVELDGGGALMNQGVHGLDILLWLLGDPVEVTARWATLAHERIEVEDTLSATIVFASGAVGTMTATTAAFPGRSVRVTLSGTDGTAIVDDERLAWLQLRDGSTAHAADGRPGSGPGMLDTTQSLAAQYADFTEAIALGRPPLVGTAQARLALATVLAIYDSARAGGLPATVDRPGVAGRLSPGT